ncbi:ATP-binding protein [Niallia sp. RD1]|uniref:ATP-binding protein n=1 Tax=Niallia sp. RD1 TaxID=2962858 RepID=UPI0020C1A67F|nr:ATP-binding protein [Niallia sp. RD1]UTI44057.1 ATP-binding protein [Niallia sp. RD1]
MAVNIFSSSLTNTLLESLWIRILPIWRVIVKAEREKGFVVIKVIDHGRGMSEEEVKSLGTPFYSLKSKGTGLGLMICFNIVEKYNGRIEFKSLKDYGTTTLVRFPYCDRAKAKYKRNLQK